jgi:hypothetical protein
LVFTAKIAKNSLFGGNIQKIFNFLTIFKAEMLGGKGNYRYLCIRIYVERLSIVFFSLGNFQGFVLNVNPPRSREGSKRARKIDHKPSAVRSKVFLLCQSK